VRTGPRTVALHAYWHGVRQRSPRIEALPDAWCWGVPLPDGSTNVLAFLDPERLRADESAEACYRGLLSRSVSGRDLTGAHLAGRVQAADATPFLDENSVGNGEIRVGDAAVAIDPISSSGVQRAVQTALAGAVVVNTLLRRPAAADAARIYYRDSLQRASDRHRAWAAEHYATAAAARPSRFWTRRAQAAPAPAARASAPTPPPDAGVPLQLSRDAAFVELPCVAGEFVEVRTGVAHPHLDEPVAYVGGWELAPLLRRAPAGATARELVSRWSAIVPESAGVAIGSWLTSRGILVAAGPEA
jgi:hypothetical protein